MNQESYIETFDAVGNKDGKQATFMEVHRNGLWHKAAHIFVADNKGNIVLQQRTKNVATYPLYFDVSAGGHVDAGYSVLETAIKETKEELGITVSNDTMLFLGTYKESSVWKELINNEFVYVYLCVTETPLATLSFEPEEVQSLLVFPWQELKTIYKDKSKMIVPHYESYEFLFDYMEKQR